MEQSESTPARDGENECVCRLAFSLKQMTFISIPYRRLGFRGVCVPSFRLEVKAISTCPNSYPKHRQTLYAQIQSKEKKDSAMGPRLRLPTPIPLHNSIFNFPSMAISTFRALNYDCLTQIWAVLIVLSRVRYKSPLVSFVRSVFEVADIPAFLCVCFAILSGWTFVPGNVEHLSPLRLSVGTAGTVYYFMWSGVDVCLFIFIFFVVFFSSLVRFVNEKNRLGIYAFIIEIDAEKKVLWFWIK